MPISTAQLSANRASGSLTYADEAIAFEYYPALITEGTLADLAAIQGASASGSAADVLAAVMHDAGLLNAALVRLLASWEVYDVLVLDEAGAVDEAASTRFPLDVARLPELPVAFRGAMLAAVVSAGRVGEATATP